jgi:hypothetical protein
MSLDRKSQGTYFYKEVTSGKLQVARIWNLRVIQDDYFARTYTIFIRDSGGIDPTTIDAS